MVAMAMAMAVRLPAVRSPQLGHLGHRTSVEVCWPCVCSSKRSDLHHGPDPARGTPTPDPAEW